MESELCSAREQNAASAAVKRASKRAETKREKHELVKNEVQLAMARGCVKAAPPDDEKTKTRH